MPNSALKSLEPCRTCMKQKKLIIFKVYIPGMGQIKIFHLMEIVLDVSIKVRLGAPLGIREQLGGGCQRKWLNIAKYDACC